MMKAQKTKNLGEIGASKTFSHGTNGQGQRNKKVRCDTLEKTKTIEQ